MNLFQYLSHRALYQRLDRLPRMYSSDYEPREIKDADAVTLMQMTHVRCPRGIEVLCNRHHALDARQLIETLPPPKYRLDVAARAARLIRRLAGTTPYDPLKSQARLYTRRANQP